jgi:hypothetical protein
MDVGTPRLGDFGVRAEVNMTEGRKVFAGGTCTSAWVIVTAAKWAGL